MNSRPRPRPNDRQSRAEGGEGGRRGAGRAGMAAMAERGAAGVEAAGAEAAAAEAGAMPAGAMPIEVLAEHGVPAADVRKLSEWGIHTVEGLAQRARRDLAQIKVRASPRGRGV